MRDLPPDLVGLFVDAATRGGDRPFLWAKRDGVYRPWSWRRCLDEARAVAAVFRAHGLGPGDRVLISSENRPEWALADLAVMLAGGITVPAYTTALTSDHRHVLTDSGAVGAIVSTQALADRLLPAVLDAPACRWVVTLEEPRRAQAGSVPLHRWEDRLDAGRTLPDDVEEVAARAQRGDTACIIYTSGTGGVPRGVMLTSRRVSMRARGSSV